MIVPTARASANNKMLYAHDRCGRPARRRRDHHGRADAQGRRQEAGRKVAQVTIRREGRQGREKPAATGAGEKPRDGAARPDDKPADEAERTRPPTKAPEKAPEKAAGEEWRRSGDEDDGRREDDATKHRRRREDRAQAARRPRAEWRRRLRRSLVRPQQLRRRVLLEVQEGEGGRRWRRSRWWRREERPAREPRSLDDLGRHRQREGARDSTCGDKSPAKGKVKVKVQVSGDGRVSNVSVETTPDPALGACVAAAVQKASFAKTQIGRLVQLPVRVLVHLSST